MNRRAQLHLLACSILLFILAACGQPAAPVTATSIPTETTVPTATPVPPTPTPTLPPICLSMDLEEISPEKTGKEVVEAMVEELNAGDLLGALAYFDEDARAYYIGVPPAPVEVAHGRAGICGVLAKHISDQLKWNLVVTSDLSGVTTAVNETVIRADSEIWLDSYQQAGMESNRFFDTFRVIDGKIVDYVAILSEESLTKWRPFIAAAQSADTAKRTEGAAGSDFNVIFSDFECIYEGPPAWKYGKANFGIEIKDHKENKYGYVIINLEKGYDIFDLAVATYGGKPSWVRYGSIFDLEYSENATTTYLVAGITKYLMCFSNKEEHIIGLLGPFPVIP